MEAHLAQRWVFLHLIRFISVFYVSITIQTDEIQIKYITLEGVGQEEKWVVNCLCEWEEIGFKGEQYYLDFLEFFLKETFFKNDVR